MGTNRYVWLVAPLIAVAACSPASNSDGSAGGADDPVSIGALLPLSGSSASAGEDMLHAAELAADDVNAGGGVLGRQVRIVSGDDACDPQTGTAAAQKMVVSGVVGVAGGYCSSASIPETAVLDPKGIPFVSAGSTNPQLTERGMQTVFRTIGRDDQQGAFAAKFLTGPVGAKQVAIVHDSTTYSLGLAEQTREAIGRLAGGAKVTFFDAITPGESDYTSTLAKIKKSGAQALYFTGYFAEGGLLVRQAHTLGLTATLVGGDANQDQTLIKTAGSAAEGFLVTTAPLPAFLPGAADFVHRFTARFDRAPGPFSVYEYDAVMAVAKAIEAAGTTEVSKVTAALRELRLTGLSGQISFTPKGDREKTVYVTAVVKDGVFVPHKHLDAKGRWVDS